MHKVFLFIASTFIIIMTLTLNFIINNVVIFIAQTITRAKLNKFMQRTHAY